MEWTQEGWDAKIKEIPIQKSDRSKWPEGIRPLSIDDEALGINKDGYPYWNGKPIMIRRKFELRWYELSLATIATAATAIQAWMAVFPATP